MAETKCEERGVWSGRRCSRTATEQRVVFGRVYDLCNIHAQRIDITRSIAGMRDLARLIRMDAAKDTHA